MYSRGKFWPDLHNLYLSFAAESDKEPSGLDRILREFNQFPPAIRAELTSDLSALCDAFRDLGALVLESKGEITS